VVTILEQVFRDQWGRVLAALIGFLGDFELAEEAAQEAFAIAAERWPRDGVPSNPGTWLVTTGRNRAIDRIRRRSRVCTPTSREIGLRSQLSTTSSLASPTRRSSS
jgi:RNA polymerase sigma-70 factor (ECF subfamily)